MQGSTGARDAPRRWQRRQRLSSFSLGCVAVCLTLLAMTTHGLAAPTLPHETVMLKKQLAYALEHSGRERQAAAVYRQLLAAGAADQEAIVRFTWLLTRQHRYRDALAVLQTIPMPHADNAILRLQADVAKWAGAMPLAERLYSELLHRKPAATAVRQEYALVLRTRGRFQEAIREYDILAQETPDSIAYLLILGNLYERTGDKHRALTAYTRAAMRRHDPDLWLKIARLHHWLNQNTEAVQWYREALDRGLRAQDAAIARYELALALFDTGKPARSMEALAPLLAKREPGSDVLLLAARAAMALGRPGEAADALTRLAETRSLSAAEAAWRAGAFRQAERYEEAHRAYAQLAQTVPPQEAVPLWEVAGDVSLANGDAPGAVAAYRRAIDLMATGESAPPDILRKMARAAELAGQSELAAQSYISYAARRRDAPEAQLTAARFLALQQRFDEAYVYYHRVEELGDMHDIQLEIARILMGAERFPEAEHYSREALTHSGEQRQATLLVAQTLHSQKKYHEEKAFLGDYLQHYPDDSEALAQMAYAAQALDRNLEAYLLFGKAIAGGASERAALTYWQGVAALHRDDIGQAVKSFEAAQRLGIDPPRSDATALERWRRTAWHIGASGAFDSDSHDLTVAQGGLYSVLRPIEMLPTRVDILRSAIDQHTTHFDRTALSLTLGDVFVTPRFALFGQVSGEFYDNLRAIQAKDAQWTGRLGGRVHFLDTSFVGLEGFRETFWSKYDQHEPRRFNRIIALKALNPGFHMDGVQVKFNKVFYPGQHAWYGEAGGAHYEDDNIQLFGYTHYQIPLVNAPQQGSWLAVKPNVYAEFFKDSKEAYFSPSSHVTIGLMGHGRQHWKQYDLELEVNPQLQITEQKVGFGMHALLDFNIYLTERLRARVGAFSFYASNEAYVLWRVTGHVEFLF
jgi:predicted Zn-dependent protease